VCVPACESEGVCEGANVSVRIPSPKFIIPPPKHVPHAQYSDEDFVEHHFVTTHKLHAMFVSLFEATTDDDASFEEARSSLRVIRTLS